VKEYHIKQVRLDLNFFVIVNTVKPVCATTTTPEGSEGQSEKKSSKIAFLIRGLLHR